MLEPYSPAKYPSLFSPYLYGNFSSFSWPFSTVAFPSFKAFNHSFASASFLSISIDLDFPIFNLALIFLAGEVTVISFVIDFVLSNTEVALTTILVLVSSLAIVKSPSWSMLVLGLLFPSISNLTFLSSSFRFFPSTIAVNLRFFPFSRLVSVFSIFIDDTSLSFLMFINKEPLNSESFPHLTLIVFPFSSLLKFNISIFSPLFLIFPSCSLISCFFPFWSIIGFFTRLFVVTISTSWEPISTATLNLLLSFPIGEASEMLLRPSFTSLRFAISTRGFIS